MATAGWQHPPGALLGRRTGIDESATIEPGGKVKIFRWKPGQGIGDSVAEEEEVVLDGTEDVELDDEDFVNGGYSVPSDIVFPWENIPVSYEAEDWDKELAEIEHNKNPYDPDDAIFCGNVRDRDPVALHSVREEPLYDPSSHHVAPIDFGHLDTTLVDGQFDDAVD